MNKTKAQIAEEVLGAKLADTIKLCEILAFLYPRQREGKYFKKMYGDCEVALHEFIYKLGLHTCINSTYYEKIAFADQYNNLLFRIDGLSGKVIEE